MTIVWHVDAGSSLVCQSLFKQKAVGDKKNRNKSKNIVAEQTDKKLKEGKEKKVRIYFTWSDKRNSLNNLDQVKRKPRIASEFHIENALKWWRSVIFILSPIS